MSKLYGLILAGGKSTRMGTDKGLLEYHGKPQRAYLYGLLKTLCDASFLSIRPEQKDEIALNLNAIVDQNDYQGPFNGILSAHHEHPNAAWLVLACDLPLLDGPTIKKLIARRDSSKMATVYATKESKLPEPLIAIWEPEGLKRAKIHLESSKSTCPRKYLMNSVIELVFPENDQVLYNANSIQEYEFAKTKLV